MTHEEALAIVETAREAGKQPDLRRADLRDADLRDADLGYASLSHANLRWANLTGADLRGADLRDANLAGADLTGANLTDAILTAADLSGANLRGANLSGADLRYASLRVADLSGTGVVPVGGGLYHGCVTPTHIHVGCVRLTWGDLPADDDLAAQAAIHEEMPDWWARYGPLVRAAMVASAADWAAREEVTP